MFREARLNAGSVALLPGNRLLVCKGGRTVILDLTKKTSKTIVIPEAPVVPYHGYEDLPCQDTRGLVNRLYITANSNGIDDICMDDGKAFQKFSNLL